MSISLTIQNTQDSQLIRILLEFVQTHNLHYHKKTSQISYKCYEATWIIQQLGMKSTGYGRTQSEAYKHSLRNLYDILIEDQEYLQYFQTLFKTNVGNQKSRQNNKVRLKTKNNETSDIILSNIKVDVNLVKSTSKTNLNGLNRESISKGSKLNSVSYLDNEMKKSNISNNNSIKEQLKEAKHKYSQLIHNLNNILSENNKLRQKIKHHQSVNTIVTNNISDSSNRQNALQNIQVGFKVVIPKLKLDVLPNYHNNSQKSLNQTLLAAYNEKHPQQKLYLNKYQ